MFPSVKLWPFMHLSVRSFAAIVDDKCNKVFECNETRIFFLLVQTILVKTDKHCNS